MRMFLVALMAALGLVSACNPNANTNNPALATDEGQLEQAAQAPASGANSFTEEQARGRLTEMGYMSPSALVQTADGVWTGQAVRNGQTVNVNVDYQGNVTENPALPLSPQ